MKNIIVVLGNRDTIIYTNRSNHAINLLKNNIDNNIESYLLLKFYKINNLNLQYFNEKLGDYKKFLFKDEDSKIYRWSRYTYDTINEALGCRCFLEKKYNEENITLTVVSSKCHEERSRWIFNEVFFDMKNINIIMDSSYTTDVEIKENRVYIEKNILNNQMNMVNYNGGMINFINKMHLSGYSHFCYKQNQLGNYKVLLDIII